MTHALNSITKALDVLFCLGRQGDSVGVSQLALELGIPKASVHRLLQALRHRHVVEKDGEGRYQLGPGLLALGLGLGSQEPLVRLAHPIMQASAATTGETFFLVGERAGDLIVLDKVEGNGLLRVSPQVGARVPAHATAAGRIYLAFAKDRVHFDEARLESFTLKTPNSPGRLRSSIESARKHGVAYNDEEWMVGLSAIAAPLWLGGRLLAAVVVACVAPRMKELGVSALTQSVLNASKKINQQLEDGS
jgi:DNA-binding IclR family transcriptional regulator